MVILSADATQIFHNGVKITAIFITEVLHPAAADDAPVVERANTAHIMAVVGIYGTRQPKYFGVFYPATVDNALFVLAAEKANVAAHIHKCIEFPYAVNDLAIVDRTSFIYRAEETDGVVMNIAFRVIENQVLHRAAFYHTEQTYSGVITSLELQAFDGATVAVEDSLERSAFKATRVIRITTDRSPVFLGIIGPSEHFDIDFRSGELEVTVFATVHDGDEVVCVGPCGNSQMESAVDEVIVAPLVDHHPHGVKLPEACDDVGVTLFQVEYQRDVAVGNAVEGGGELHCTFVAIRGVDITIVNADIAGNLFPEVVIVAAFEGDAVVSGRPVLARTKHNRHDRHSL